MQLGGGLDLGNLVDQIIGGFTSAVFEIFKRLAEALVGPIADQIAGPILDIVTYTPKPQYCPSGPDVSSCSSSPNPALVTRPENGAWPGIWDLYWGKFFVAALFIGLLLYTMTNFVASIPWVNAEFRERLRGGYLRMLVSLSLGWPVMTVTLYIMSILNDVAAPTQARFETFITQLISGMVVAAASPVSIISTSIGSISITLIAITVALYILRILFLMSVFAIAPLLIMSYSLEIPIAKDLSKSIFGLWVKLGIAPMFTALCFNIATLLTTSATGSGGYEYTGFDAVGAGSTFVNLALGFVVPFIGIFGLYIVVQAQLPAGASRGVAAMQRKMPTKRIGGLGKKKTTKTRKIRDDDGNVVGAVQEPTTEYSSWRKTAQRAQERGANFRGQVANGAYTRARAAAGQARTSAKNVDWDPGPRSSVTGGYGGRGGRWNRTRTAAGGGGGGGGPQPVVYQEKSIQEALRGGAPNRTPPGRVKTEATSSVGTVIPAQMQQTSQSTAGSTGPRTQVVDLEEVGGEDYEPIDTGQNKSMYDMTGSDKKGDIYIRDEGS